MDFRSLELFFNLSTTLHFGRTSAACHISPSALSRTIQRVEGEIGHLLFVRDNRTVQLSPAGQRFREYAARTLEAWEQFRDSMAEQGRDLSGEVRLYSSVTAAYTILADLFARFREAYPDIHIRLETGDAAHAIERVSNGTAEVAVAARPGKLPAGLAFKTVTVTPLAFIAPMVSCETAAMTAAPAIEWRRVPMILAEQALSRRRVDGWFRNRGHRPLIYAEVAGHEAILSMVRLGCGVGVVPRLVLDHSSIRDEIRVLDVEPELEPYEVGLCAHKRKLGSPLVRAFWDTAPDLARDLCGCADSGLGDLSHDRKHQEGFGR